MSGASEDGQGSLGGWSGVNTAVENEEPDWVEPTGGLWGCWNRQVKKLP